MATIKTAISLLFLFAVAHASKNTPMVAPLTDDTFLVRHYQEIVVGFGIQVFGFFVWMCKNLYEWFIKKEDKTESKFDLILEQNARMKEAIAVMQEDVKNIKYSMVTKNEAHNMIQAEIIYANDLRSRQQS